MSSADKTNLYDSIALDHIFLRHPKNFLARRVSLSEYAGSGRYGHYHLVRSHRSVSVGDQFFSRL